MKHNIENPHICMESTGCYSESVAEFFHNLGMKVSVVNPWRIKAFHDSCLIRQKTDSSDAQMIVEFCRMHNPDAWTPKSPGIKAIHEINRRIDSLKIEQNRTSNILEKQNLPEVVLRSVNSEIEFLKQQIGELEEEIRKIIENNKDLMLKFQRLMEVKGVGERTAIAILTDMPDVSNFEKSEQFAAFAGVTAAHFESGTSG